VQETVVLTKLLQKDQKTGFDVKFEFLTGTLADAVGLEFPDWSLPFSLRTDASKEGFAAVLTQLIPGTNRRRMLAVASRHRP
jgi:hypothetical protein